MDELRRAAQLFGSIGTVAVPVLLVALPLRTVVLLDLLLVAGT